MLEFDGVTKRFGSVMALDGCTLMARPGRLTGFLGPNGAGKTTAMRAVFGLVQLDAGTVCWQGAPITPAARGRLGYMPEERGLYPRMRVRDQLVYLGRLCGRPAKDVGLSVDGWLDRLGLAARAADRLDALSHGNQQRVQLIAALVGDPDLLVLHGGPRLSLQAAWRSATTPAPGAATTGTPITSALPHRARATAGGKTMTGTDQTSYRILTTVLTGTAVALGIAVGLLTRDVILGVIAGFGLFAITVQMIRLWSGHRGPPVSHQ